MGLNTLVERAVNAIVTRSWANDLRTALLGSFVGRNETDGQPESGKSLGTALYPWGPSYVTSLVVAGSQVDFADQESAPYRIVSGAKRSGSNQPLFIDPAGSGASATLLGLTTPLVVQINGQEYSVTTDVAMTGLTTAPSSQNTATISVDSAYTGNEASRTIGEKTSPYQYSIPLASVGTNITAKIGKRAAFKLNSEYILATVESGRLIDCYRGFFYNSSGAPINRGGCINGDTVTLMSLGWVFAKSDGGANVSFTNPEWAATAPTSPSTNDYWYDVTNKLWKQYNGASWVETTRILVGLVVLDSTNCVAARSFDFHAVRSITNTIEVTESSNSVAYDYTKGMISVNGNLFRFENSLLQWNMATDLAASADMHNATEQASRRYYYYITDEGAPKISDIPPYYRPDLYGWYHPHLPWRAVGSAFNSSGSDTVDDSFFSYRDRGLINQIWFTDTSGLFENATTSYVGITNTRKKVTINKGAARIKLQPYPTSGSPSAVGVYNGSTTNGWIRLTRDGTQIAIWEIPKLDAAAVPTGGMHPDITFIDKIQKGSYVYVFEAKSGSAATFGVYNMQVVVEELDVAGEGTGYLYS